jgi:hypothetical protein
MFDESGGPHVVETTLTGRIDLTSRSYDLSGELQVSGRDGRDFMLGPETERHDNADLGPHASTVPQPLGLLDAALGIATASRASSDTVAGTSAERYECVADLVTADERSPGGILVGTARTVADLRAFGLTAWIDDSGLLRGLAVSRGGVHAALELSDFEGILAEAPVTDATRQPAPASVEVARVGAAIERTLRGSSAAIRFAIEAPSGGTSAVRAKADVAGRLDFRAKTLVLTHPASTTLHRGGILMPTKADGSDPAFLDGDGLPQPGQPFWVLDLTRGLVSASSAERERVAGQKARRFDCTADIVEADARSGGMRLSSGESIRELRNHPVTVWIDGSDQVRKVGCELRQSRTTLLLSELR